MIGCSMEYKLVPAFEFPEMSSNSKFLKNSEYLKRPKHRQVKMSMLTSIAKAASPMLVFWGFIMGNIGFKFFTVRQPRFDGLARNLEVFR